MKELLTIEPSENEMYHLRQHESVLDKPFFNVISIGEMEKVDIFSRRLRELSIRAGYPPCLIIHDFRAEGLYLIDMFLSSSFFISILELIRRI